MHSVNGANGEEEKVQARSGENTNMKKAVGKADETYQPELITLEEKCYFGGKTIREGVCDIDQNEEELQRVQCAVLEFVCQSIESGAGGMERSTITLEMLVWLLEMVSQEGPIDVGSCKQVGKTDWALCRRMDKLLYVWYFMGVLEYRNGELDEAERDFRRLLRYCERIGSRECGLLDRYKVDGTRHFRDAEETYRNGIMAVHFKQRNYNAVLSEDWSGGNGTIGDRAPLRIERNYMRAWSKYGAGDAREALAIVRDTKGCGGEPLGMTGRLREVFDELCYAVRRNGEVIEGSVEELEQAEEMGRKCPMMKSGDIVDLMRVKKNAIEKMKNREFNGAIAVLEHAVKKCDTDCEMIWLLSVCYWEGKEKRKACEMTNAYLSKCKDNEYAERARTMIGRCNASP